METIVQTSTPSPVSAVLPPLKFSQLPEAEAKFQLACKQLILLNNAIRELNVRYERALQRNQRAVRYSLRLRLCTIEGLRNMFHEYATDLADRLDALERASGMTTDELMEQDLGSGTLAETRDQTVEEDDDEQMLTDDDE